MNIILVILAIIGGAIVLPIIGWALWKAVSYVFGLVSILIRILVEDWQRHHRREAITFRDGWGKLHRVYKD